MTLFLDPLVVLFLSWADEVEIPPAPTLEDGIHEIIMQRNQHRLAAAIEQITFLPSISSMPSLAWHTVPYSLGKN
jgi:hypothetical protein